MKKALLAGAALSLLMSTSAYADIIIATAGPMTGQYASFGEQMKTGAEQAVADINAAGGINGEMLKLEVGDDAPAFELPGTDGNTHSLAQYKGTAVVLAWFPKAFTGG